MSAPEVVMRIRDIMSAKGSDVVVITPEATVADLVALLSEHNLGAVVVAVDGRTVEGIVSERDVVRRLVAGAEVLSSSVADIMTRDVHSCRLDDSVQSLATTMTNKRIRHLPVVEDGELRGIVSIGDVVKSHISDLEFERAQLEGYLSR
jgi:CBS domain-containing protein